MKNWKFIMVVLVGFLHLNSMGQEQTPTIVYSTYYGNIGTDDADAIAVDTAGNIYLGCHSDSANLLGVKKFPYTLNGGMDALVVKLNDKGSEVNYITQLGGSKWDAIQGLIADDMGNIYAVGTTYSSDFPIGHNGFQSKFGGKSDAFVVKLSPDGKVVWSTFLGGSNDEDGRDITIDQHGNIHIIGRTESQDFPTSAKALQSHSAGGIDAFVATFDPYGKMLLTTYLGGSGNDVGFSIKLDNMCRRYIAGTTDSTDFPMKSAFQKINHGEEDLFFAIIDPTGSSLEFTSYLGGKGADKLYDIDVGPSGDVFIMGMTDSSDFPTTPRAFQPKFAGVRDTFVTRLNLEDMKVTYSTYIGGENGDSPRKFVVDNKGNAVIVGQTASKNFPLVNSHQNELRGDSDAFITMLDSSGTFLIYSSLFGGEGIEMYEDVKIGADGSLTLSGLSDSKDFPLVNPIQNTFLGGRFDIVVTRLVHQKQE